jgi:putative spermidine/putrescine transport system substrate-binding protein
VFGGVTACGGDDEAETATPTPTPEAAPVVPTQAPIASPVAGYLDPLRWDGRTLGIATSGGEVEDAMDEAFFEPFELATGVSIQRKTMDLGRLKNQVEDEAVTWDVVDVPTEEVLPLSRGDYLHPIDYNVVDNTPLFPDVVMQYGVGVGFFSTVIAYGATATRVPSGWPDFWDVEGFGAGRALWQGPVGTLEFALQADGVSMADLYPLDVERAFASLDRIREDVVVWYQNGLQPVELVANGQAAMASAWNVRVDTPDVRDLVRIQWYGGMLSADSWVVPRGAPNVDVAMDFINYATRAIPGANFVRLVPFGPVNRETFPLLIPERAALLPTFESNRAIQFVEGWNWWADNRESLTERFTDWLLQEPPAEATPE